MSTWVPSLWVPSLQGAEVVSAEFARCRSDRYPVELMYDWRDALLGAKDRSCSCPVKRVLVAGWILFEQSILFETSRPVFSV